MAWSFYDQNGKVLQGVLAVSIGTTEIADDAVTLAKMAGGTDGNLITYDASGDPAYVATGSSGQILTSAGTGQPPAFAAAAGVGLGMVIALGG